MKETTTEVVIVAGAALAGLWLWLANRKAGAGTGLESLPILFGSGATGAAGAAGAGLDGVAPVGGDTFTYNGAPISLPPNAPQVSVPGVGMGGCGCGCESQQQPQFGSTTTLISYLSSLPATAANNIATAGISLIPAAKSPDVAQQVADMSYGSGQFSAGETTQQLVNAQNNAFDNRLLFSGMWN